MKTILCSLILATIPLSVSVHAADLSVYRICEDKHVIHTSDGADGGHVEYIMVDPDNQQIVSAIVTGGVVGEKHITLPYSSFRYSGDGRIELTDIDRERFVGAPTVEVSRFSTSLVVAPTIVESSRTYWGSAWRGSVGENRTREGVEPGRNAEAIRGDVNFENRNRIDTRNGGAPAEASSTRATEKGTRTTDPSADRANEVRGANAARGNPEGAGANPVRGERNAAAGSTVGDPANRSREGHSPESPNTPGNDSATSQRNANAASAERSTRTPAAGAEDRSTRAETKVGRGANSEAAAKESRSESTRETGASEKKTTGETVAKEHSETSTSQRPRANGAEEHKNAGEKPETSK